MKKTIMIGLAVCLLIGAVLGVIHMTGSMPDNLEEIVDWGSVYAYGEAGNEDTRITVQVIGEENHLILPATASPEEFALFFDVPDPVSVSAAGDLKSMQIRSGEPIDLTRLCSEGRYELELKARSGRAVCEYALKLSFADQIATMYLLSDDPENEGRAWVESSPDKSNKATGRMLLINADGEYVYQDALTQIKGRGNSTWLCEKKPYQIKLSTKTDLLQTGSDDNGSKTWVLLANYSDYSNMRNTLIYNLGLELGMECCTQNRWVNLYYDGAYRGCYMLSEKVEIGSGRVDITDLEELNEEMNPDVELDELPVEEGMTSNGAAYRYCVGMNSPEDVTGGYLLELELSTRLEAEVCYFTTRRGRSVVVKSPEYASKEEMDYIASLFQEWEDALYSGGVNPTTGKRYTDYVDLRSAAVCYLANEISKNQDGFHTSAYFYKDSQSDLMYMGPLWDYDVTMNFNGEMEPTGFDTAKAGLAAAMCELGDFREEVRRVYLQEVYPVMTGVVLAEGEAASESSGLCSIRQYETQLQASMDCNSILWPNTKQWKQDVQQLLDFLAVRTEYLMAEITEWSAQTEFVLPVSPFADVDENAWYCEDIYKAVEYGLMAGGGGDAFNPDLEAIRFHVILTMYNMEGKPLVEYRQAFSDVGPHDVYANAVSWAVQNGVLVEDPEGLLEPMEQISREEVVVYLHRYLGSPAAELQKLSEYTDGAEVSEYAQEAMAWAAAEEILATADGELRPLEAITRAELASVLVRFHDRFLVG